MGERLKGKERDKELRFFVFHCEGVEAGSPGHPMTKEPHIVIKVFRVGSLNDTVTCPQHDMSATLIKVFKTQEELIEYVEDN